MPTPIENLTQNVNASTQQTVLQAVADDATARQQAADKASAINAIVDNADQQALQNFFGGIVGDATAEDLLTGDNAIIDKVSEDVDAIETLNTEERAIRKILCRREGRDPANFADLDAVAADLSLVQALSLREESTNIIRYAVKAHTAISGNDRSTREMMCHPVGLDATTFIDVQDLASDNVAMTTIIDDAQARRVMVALPLAMQGVASSQTAMQEVINSQLALDEVVNSQTAMQEVAASQTAMQEVAPSQTAMQAVASSQTAMQEVAPSQTAMQEVAVSQTAMQEVAASQTAMQEVAASQTAMQEVVASQTALDEIGNNSVVQNTVYNNNTAISELNNSNLIETASSNIQRSEIDTLKSDRVILVAHSDGAGGNRSNQPQFGSSNNSFPHTADRIKRGTNFNSTSSTNHSASFIDISNS